MCMSLVLSGFSNISLDRNCFLGFKQIFSWSFSSLKNESYALQCGRDLLRFVNYQVAWAGPVLMDDYPYQMFKS